MSMIREDFSKDNQESVRAGFGRGLVKAAAQDDKIVALVGDLKDSLQMTEFAQKFGPKFIDVGVAEQNLVTVASGLAAAGKIPFAGSYAAFSPGRNWEQIRTTICLNDRPVKIIGSHAGLNVGHDGATHQMLEDIALMRSLPNMQVFSPGDAIEAEKITLEIAKNNHPSYVRLAREKTAIYNKDNFEFQIGKGYRLIDGDGISVFSTGVMTPNLIEAAESLRQKNINIDLIHFPTIKPLDEEIVLESLQKTGRAVTVEEGQIYGGFGGAIAELISEKFPAPLKIIGVRDQFGESGKVDQLWHKHELDSEGLVEQIAKFYQKAPKYQPGY